MNGATAVFCGVEIPEVLLAAEMQNHRAPTLADARAQAGRALAARAVLLARARTLGLAPQPETNAAGQEETQDEALIRAVLSAEVDATPPSDARIREVYEHNPDGFRSPPLMEASHILVAPENDTEQADHAARRGVEALLAQLQSDSRQFERLAAEHSACPSSKEGGWLGQLRPDDVLSEIWEALLQLEPGKISTAPVRTEHGWHILRLDRFAAGQRLPFEHVRSHIALELEARAWTRAAALYVDRLLLVTDASARLKLDESGGLDDGEGGVRRAAGILGGALADPLQAFAALPEGAQQAVVSAATLTGDSAENVLRGMIGKFLSASSDEVWTQLISRLRDSEAPLADCLSLIVERELPERSPSRTLIRMRNSAQPAS